jgi:hypothetical protein
MPTGGGSPSALCILTVLEWSHHKSILFSVNTNSVVLVLTAIPLGL